MAEEGPDFKGIPPLSSQDPKRWSSRTFSFGLLVFFIAILAWMAYVFLDLFRESQESGAYFLGKPVPKEDLTSPLTPGS